MYYALFNKQCKWVKYSSIYVCISAIKVKLRICDYLNMFNSVSFCYLSFTVNVFIQCDIVTVISKTDQVIQSGQRLTKHSV